MKPLLPDEIAAEIKIPEEGCYCSLCETARRNDVVEFYKDGEKVGGIIRANYPDLSKEANRRLSKRV